MSFRVELEPTLREVLDAAERPLAGMWVCSGSPTAAEIAASSGLDLLLVDGEHSPMGLETVVSLLRTAHGYPVTPVVRLPALDTVLVKQYLDLGAQNLLVPMVDTAEQAVEAVRATRYPSSAAPDGTPGVRGVGAGFARAARWNGVPGYLADAEQHLSLTVQIESGTAVDHAAEIAAVEGVDALFVGPADLGATIGHLGDQAHPEVVEAVLRTIEAGHGAGTPVGVNAFDPEQAQAYLDAGADFVFVTADVTLMAAGARAAAQRWVG